MMEPINERLLGYATLAYNTLIKHCGFYKNYEYIRNSSAPIIPLRDYMSEHLFMSFLNNSSDHEVEVCYKLINVNEYTYPKYTQDDNRYIQDLSDTTSSHYKPTFAVYGRGIYVTPYITSFIKRSSNEFNVIVAMLVVRGTSTSVNVSTSDGEFQTDSLLPKPHILILRSACQVLPVFALPFDCYNRDPHKCPTNLWDYEHVSSLLCGPNIDESLLPCVELVKETFPEVKTGVIYQLLYRFMTGRVAANDSHEYSHDELDINDAYLYVSNTLMNYDYTC